MVSNLLEGGLVENHPVEIYPVEIYPIINIQSPAINLLGFFSYVSVSLSLLRLWRVR